MAFQARDLAALISTLYDHFNFRQTGSSLQPLELWSILSDDDFDDFFNQVCCEILQLEGAKERPSNETPREWAIRRGYAVGRQTDSTDTDYRAKLLYEAMTDLLTVRIIKKKSQVKDAVLVSYKKSPGLSRILSSVDTMKRKLLPPSDFRCSPQTVVSDLQSVYQALEGRAIEAASSPAARYPHLIYPDWSLILASSKRKVVPALIQSLNREYRFRRLQMSKLLDVTSTAFLWSSKSQDPLIQSAMAKILQRSLCVRREFQQREIYAWDVLSATRSVLSSEFDVVTYSDTALKSSMKVVTMGAVPNRGGLPDGYTAQQIHVSVETANLQLQKKDAQNKSTWPEHKTSNPQQLQQQDYREERRGPPRSVTGSRGPGFNQAREHQDEYSRGSYDNRWQQERLPQQQYQHAASFAMSGAQPYYYAPHDQYGRQLHNQNVRPLHFCPPDAMENIGQPQHSFLSRYPNKGRGSRGRGGFYGRNQGREDYYSDQPQPCDQRSVRESRRRHDYNHHTVPSPDAFYHSTQRPPQKRFRSDPTW